VQLASGIAVGDVGRDEGGDGEGGRGGEELGDLADATDVLVAVLLAEAEVLVQAHADVVAVKPEGALAELEDGRLERDAERALAGRWRRVSASAL